MFVIFHKVSNKNGGKKIKKKNGVGDENYHCLINNSATIIKHGTCKKIKVRLMVQKKKAKKEDSIIKEFRPS